MQDGPHSIYLLDLLFDELSLYFTVVRKEVSTLLSLKSFFCDRYAPYMGSAAQL